VFWVDASSLESITTSLKGISNIPAAQAFGVDGSVESVLQWIAFIQEEWLIVFDNANDLLPEAVVKFFPPGDNGNILITSQNRSMGRIIPFGNIIEISEMEKSDATLLLRASHLEQEPSDVEEGPSRTNSQKDLVIGENGLIPIEEEEPELSASCYAEQNPADQAQPQPHPYQSLLFNGSQSSPPLELPIDSVGPIMASLFPQPIPQTHVSTTNTIKEYGMDKPTPFNGDRTKVKIFLQECLVYLEMNKEIYTMDKLKIGFVLSYMTEKEASAWKELYLKSIEDPNTGKLIYPTFNVFLGEVQKAFWSTDQVQDAVNKLETLKQGKMTAEELIMEFQHLIRQAGLEMRSKSDHIHLIRLFSRALNPQLAWQILFGKVVPKTIDDWFENAVQLEMNHQIAMANSGQSSGWSQKNEANGGHGHWYKPAEKKDSNVMDVDASTMEERMTLMKQGKCFHCKKQGHIVKNCLERVKTPEPKKDFDPVKDAFTKIQALTKDQKDAFAKMMLENSADENI
jgi:hypothetical protein